VTDANRNQFDGGRQVTNAIWNRLGPAAGLLFFPVLMAGFFIHRYPDVRPTDAHLANWLANVNASTFRFGVYVEALGVLLLIPFAAWLYGRVRQGAKDSSTPATAMLIATAAWVALTLPINESWAGLVDQARSGLDIRVAQTIISINQASYDMTGIVLGVILLSAGVAIVRGGAMSRWVGWAAVIIGLFGMVSAPFGTDATPLSLLAYLWILGVGGYYTFRPAANRDLAPAVGRASGAPEPV
jgi:hypothetical protein